MLHARSATRADETRKKIAGAEDIVVGDLASIAETKSVADEVNKLGRFDAVIHNAGIGYREPKLVKTADGLPQLFAVNTLGPYILTALIRMPKRLVYLSSGMHYGALTGGRSMHGYDHVQPAALQSPKRCYDAYHLMTFFVFFGAMKCDVGARRSVGAGMRRCGPGRRRTCVFRDRRDRRTHYAPTVARQAAKTLW